MSSEIPTGEPNSIIQGTTMKWYKPLPDYPPTEWTLTYAIRGPSTLDVTATADNDRFLATISATEAAKLTTGKYWMQGFVTKDGERYVIFQGTLTVEPDLAEQPVDYDGRTYAEIVRDAIEAVLKNRASKDQKEISIGNKSISRMEPDELRKWRDQFRKEVQDQQRAERIRRGGYSGRTIYTRFSS